MVGRQALTLMLEEDVSLSRVDAHGLSVTSASEPLVLTPHLTAKHTQPAVTTVSLASTASTLLRYISVVHKQASSITNQKTDA